MVPLMVRFLFSDSEARFDVLNMFNRFLIHSAHCVIARLWRRLALLIIPYDALLSKWVFQMENPNDDPREFQHNRTPDVEPTNFPPEFDSFLSQSSLPICPL
jgi:hypothetical protein